MRWRRSALLGLHAAHSRRPKAAHHLSCSFRDDGRKVRDDAWHYYTRGVFALLTGTVEERLARIMRRFGPFLAIGKPSEELPETGAARMYVGDDDWQAAVGPAEWRDALAVLQAGETEGLRWELGRIGCNLKPEQALLFLPFGLWNNGRGEQHYRDFREWAEDCLPVTLPKRLNGSCFIYFTGTSQGRWRAHVLHPSEPIVPRHPLWPILERLLGQNAFFPRWFSLKGTLGWTLAVIAILLLCVISGMWGTRDGNTKRYLERYRYMATAPGGANLLLQDDMENTLPSTNVDPEALSHTKKVISLLKREKMAAAAPRRRHRETDENNAEL